MDWTLGLLTGAALVGGAAWAWRRLERYAIQGMTRPPRSALRTSPAEVGLVWEDVAFETGDGVRIYAWFLPAGREPKAANDCQLAMRAHEALGISLMHQKKFDDARTAMGKALEYAAKTSKSRRQR